MSYVESTSPVDFEQEAITAFKGKTILNIDTSAQNVIYFNFTDGSVFTLWSECGYTGFPFFMLAREIPK